MLLHNQQPALSPFSDRPLYGTNNYSSIWSSSGGGGNGNYDDHTIFSPRTRIVLTTVNVSSTQEPVVSPNAPWRQTLTTYNNMFPDITAHSKDQLIIESIQIVRTQASTPVPPNDPFATSYTFFVILPDIIERVTSGNSSSDTVLYIGNLRDFIRTSTNQLGFVTWVDFQSAVLQIPLSSASVKQLTSATQPLWKLQVQDVYGADWWGLNYMQMNFFCSIKHNSFF